MDFNAIIYYSAVWLIGTVVGCFRAGRDGDFNGLIHLFCVGAISGSLAFGIVAIGGFYANGHGAIGCGTAAVVGTLGREVTDTLLIDVAGAISAKVRMIFGTKDDDEK